MIWDNYIYKFLLILSLAAFVSSCSNTKYLTKNEYLLIDNDVIFSDDSEVVDKNNLKNALNKVAIQQPNKNFLGLFRVKLRFYNRALKKERKGKYRNWMKNVFGEPPVLLDTALLSRSEENMEKYLFNKGYFDAQVNAITKFNKKKVTIKYLVESGQPYIVKQIAFKCENEKMQSIMEASAQKSYLQIGSNYDIDNFKLERDRITTELRNKGYYRASIENISFSVDTLDSKYNLSVDVFLAVEGGNDKIYKIGDIYIYPDETQKNPVDTLNYDVKGYHILFNKLEYRPSVLINHIYFQHGDIYNLNNHLLTISRLSALYSFRYASVKFNPIDSLQMLTSYIYLTPEKKNDIQVEIEASNTDYQQTLGSAVKTTYNRRNLFGLADLFTLNFRGGVEFQFSEGQPNLFSSNLTLGADFYFPRFIMPFIKLRKLSKSFNPTTHVSSSYSFYTRQEFYTLNSTNFAFSYDWHETRFKRHIVTPITLSYNKLTNTTAKFEEILGVSNFYRSSFSDQLILGAAYTFIYNNKRKNIIRNFINFQADIELAGNALRAGSQLFTSSSGSDVKYKVLGIDFSQYARFDLDITYYYVLNKRQTLIYRLGGGIGVPYGNSEVMPYIKQFFAGGPNSLRAWRVRSLGPGSYSADPDEVASIALFDQTGDIQLEANVEYRFPIVGLIKGALFADAGNIWTLKPDPSRPGAEFQGNTFVNEIAIGAGFGLRFDFSFFILRFDMGYPLRDPAFPLGERWRIGASQVVYNFAIGYPF